MSPIAVDRVVTHNMVDSKDRSDIDTGIDVGGTIQRIKDHTVSPLVLVLDDDGLLVLLRHEHRGLARRAKSIYHDVVRQHIELLLIFALDIRLSSQANPRDGIGCEISLCGPGKIESSETLWPAAARRLTSLSIAPCGHWWRGTWM